ADVLGSLVGRGVLPESENQPAGRAKRLVNFAVGRSVARLCRRCLRPPCLEVSTLMDGPEIIRRSISAARIPDRYGNVWQYHSRSDRHSKVACWVIAFDLMDRSPLFRDHIATGKVVLGVNHTLRDFQTQRKK